MKDNIFSQTRKNLVREKISLSEQEIEEALPANCSQEGWYKEQAEKLDACRERLKGEWAEGTINLEACSEKWSGELRQARAVYANDCLRLPYYVRQLPKFLQGPLKEEHEGNVSRFLDGAITCQEAESEYEVISERARREYIPVWKRTDSGWDADNFPTEYKLSIDLERLPNKRAFDEVMSFHDKSKGDGAGGKKKYGIVAFGKTGTGKTRSIYELISRALETDLWDCHEVQIVSAPNLAAKVRHLAMSDVDLLEKDLDKLKYARVLFLDDLHQAKFTPRYAEELMRLIEARYNQQETTFITCQVAGDALVRKLSGDNSQLRGTAEAIVRRIRDMCEPIDFDSK
jgi:DNA replication protein DnaC